MKSLLVLTLLVLAIIRLKQWLSLPHRCPSCGSRFDEVKVDRFYQIGGKDVYFCKKCIDHPVDRLEINHVAFAAKGFSAEDIDELYSAIYDYKQ